MMTLYNTIVVIHILSAIVGLGPGFVLTYIVMKAENMTELRQGYKVRKQIHIFVMLGGTLLLITGILLGILNPILFIQGLYLLIFVLFLIDLVTSYLFIC